MSRRRNGFTFVELCVSAGLLVALLGVLAFLGSGARRSESLASLHLGLMENVSLAIHQLRTDLRQLTFVPGKKVDEFSIRISGDYNSVIMRRSAPVVGTQPGSGFVFVEYRLVPSDTRPDRFHLQRIERTANGEPLPGKSVSVEERTFRSFMLADATFLYREEDAEDVRVLHTAFRVVTDSGPMPGWGPFREKELLLTNALSVLRPEAAFDESTQWAEKVEADAEIPPDDVLAPPALDSGRIIVAVP